LKIISSLHFTCNFFYITIQRSLTTDLRCGVKSINRNWQSLSWQKIPCLLLKSEVRYSKQKDPAIGPHHVLAFQALTQSCWCVSHLSIFFSTDCTLNLYW